MDFKKLITKKVEFSASHRYWNLEWSEKRNKEVFGKNVSPMGHGHNFVLEVTVEGEVDEQTGMIVNLFDLKSIITIVLKQFDHKFLNVDNEYFRDLNPTPENIAKVLWNLIEYEIENLDKNLALYKVRLYETPDLYVDYWREK